jgi:hypothetical protein
MPLIAVFLLLAGSRSAGRPAGPGDGQEPEGKLPAAETILERYIQVTGGKAAYSSLHNILSRGTFRVVGTPLRGNYTAYEAEPSKTRTIFEFEGGEKDEQGTLGDLAWERSSSGGPRLIQGDEKVVALREATFNSMLNWRSLYRKAESAGMEKVGGRDCYRVVLTPAAGKPLTQYFDVESGLLSASFIILDSPGGELRSENFYDAYRKDNVEVLFPHKLTHRIAREEMVIVLESVRCNVDIAWYRFDLPPEVKALTRGGARK